MWSVRRSLKNLQVKISILDCLDDPGFDPTVTHPVFVVFVHRSEGLKWMMLSLAVRSTQLPSRVDRDFIHLALSTSPTVAANKSLHLDKRFIGSDLIHVRMREQNRPVASCI